MAEKIFGPQSFASGVANQAPQAPSLDNGSQVNAGIQGQAGQLTANAPGGEFEKQAQINQQDIQAIWGLAEKVMEPKVKEMQAFQFAKGMSRAARGESMNDIRADQPFWSKIWGESMVTEGARFYAARTASAREQQALLDEMPELAKKSPQEVDAIMTERMLTKFEKNDSYDPQTMAQIIQGNVEAMPALMKTHQNMYYRNIQEESAYNFQQYGKSMIDLNNQIRERIGSGDLSKEQGEQMIASNLANLEKPPGISEEAYTNGIMSVREYAIDSGNGDIEEYMQSGASAAGINPSERLKFAQQIHNNRNAAMAGALKNNPTLAKRYMAGLMSIKALPAEKRMEAAEKLNEEMQTMTGVKGQWYDAAQIGAEAASDAAKQAADARKFAILSKADEAKALAKEIPLGAPGRAEIVLPKLRESLEEAIAIGDLDMARSIQQDIIEEEKARPIRESVDEAKQKAKDEAELAKDELKEQQKEAIRVDARAKLQKMAVSGASLPEMDALLSSAFPDEKERTAEMMKLYRMDSTESYETTLGQVSATIRKGGGNLPEPVSNVVFRKSDAEALRMGEGNATEGLAILMQVASKPGNERIRYAVKKEMGVENYIYAQTYIDRTAKGATEDEARKAATEAVKNRNEAAKVSRPTVPGKERRSAIVSALDDTYAEDMDSNGAKEALIGRIDQYSKADEYADLTPDQADTEATSRAMSEVVPGKFTLLERDENAKVPLERSIAEAGLVYHPEILSNSVMRASVNYLNGRSNGSDFRISGRQIQDQNGKIVMDFDRVGIIEERVDEKGVSTYYARDNISGRMLEVQFTRKDLIDAMRSPYTGGAPGAKIKNPADSITRQPVF